MSVRRRTILIVGLGCLGLLITSAAVGGFLIYANFFTPIDDPGYFCYHPQPSPEPSLTASLVLQECSSGESVTIQRRDTVAVDLKIGRGVDTSQGWRDVAVSDPSVLATVVAPADVVSGGMTDDEIAVYKGARVGLAEITAMENNCGVWGCDGRHRWWVFVRVV